MERFSRRDFLKLTAFSLAAIPFHRLASVLNLENPEKVEQYVPEFKYVGPYIDFMRSGQSDGERSGWIDPDNADKMMVGTWMHGLWKTLDAGKNWEQMNIPVLEKSPYGIPSVARDMITVPGTGETLIVFDYSLALGSVDGSNWGIVNLPTDSYIAQTACILPCGKVFIGGCDDPQSKFTGLAMTDITNIKNVIEYNKNHPDSLKSPDWQTVNGIFPMEYWSFIRTIAHLPSLFNTKPGKILFGGWLGMSSSKNPGTGLYCINDKNFSLIDDCSFPFNHTLDSGFEASMSINMIKALHYRGHEIVLVGGEGSGGGGSYNPNYPHFQIIVDGTPYPQEVVNCKGIEISEESGDVFVSTSFKEISHVSLDDILTGNVINWKRITRAPEGQADTGSLHIMLSQNSKKEGVPVLMMCREVWGNGPFPFQQVGVAKLNDRNAVGIHTSRREE
jgi:hypothetical protein